MPSDASTQPAGFANGSADAQEIVAREGRFQEDLRSRRSGQDENLTRLGRYSGTVGRRVSVQVWISANPGGCRDEAVVRSGPGDPGNGFSGGGPAAAEVGGTGLTNPD